ncbi:MAG: type II toxin-antitoxin system PemK/MazF family toxin [Candidatus Babeliaceae bacterium]|jgi:mRNA interferase MazF
MSKFPKRGDIYWVALDLVAGSEIAKTRPAVIISNNAGNEASSRVIVVPITSSVSRIFPFEVAITVKDKQGKILVDQIRTIDKSRLVGKIGTCEKDTLAAIDNALKIVLAFD